MFKKLKKFIRDIQKSDLKRRKRWFFIFSFMLVFVIIVLWFLYLNMFYSLNESGTGFFSKIKQEWLVFKKGFNEVNEKTKQEMDVYLKNIKEKVGKKKEIDLKSTTTAENSETSLEKNTTSEEITKLLENLMMVLTSSTSTNLNSQTSTNN